jgi:hypothetical protein
MTSNAALPSISRRIWWPLRKGLPWIVLIAAKRSQPGSTGVASADRAVAIGKPC